MTQAWDAKKCPVREYALVTESSDLWGPLLALLASEISNPETRFYAVMPELIHDALARAGMGDRAHEVRCYRPTRFGWLRFE
jgi:hypothetical protein